MAFSSKIHAIPDLPPTWFVAVYGSNQRQHRPLIEAALAPFLNKMAVFLGDFNAITQWTDVKGVSVNDARSLLWPWLAYLEVEGKLVDLLRQGTQWSPPMTRVRGYRGSSYLDRIYVTNTLFPLLQPVKPRCFSLLVNDQPLGDHDVVSLDIMPWSFQSKSHPTCAGWTPKHVKLFHRHLETLLPGASVENADLWPPERQLSTISALVENMLEAMRGVH